MANPFLYTAAVLVFTTCFIGVFKHWSFRRLSICMFWPGNLLLLFVYLFITHIVGLFALTISAFDLSLWAFLQSAFSLHKGPRFSQLGGCPCLHPPPLPSCCSVCHYITDILPSHIQSRTKLHKKIHCILHAIRGHVWMAACCW